MAPKQNGKGKKKAKGSGTAMAARPIGPEVTPMGRSVVMRNTQPKLSATKGGGVRVCNTERLEQLSVVTGGVFTRNTAAFNPAASALAPWLSNIAKNYSMYRLHKLEWAYTPFVATTTGGEVMMGVFYDDEEAENFRTSGDQQTLSQVAEFTAGPVWAGGAMSSSESSRTSYFGVKADVTAAHRRSPWFLCDPVTSPGPNRNMAVAAYLGTGIISAGTGVNGTVYVTYDIEFIKPTAPTHQ